MRLTNVRLTNVRLTNVRLTNVRLTNVRLNIPNEQRTTNNEQQTTNNEQQTTNNEQQTMETTVTVPVIPIVNPSQADESPEATILANLKQRLQEITELKHIDEDWGQLDDYSPNHPVKWPCALIDITQATYSNLGQDAQRVPKNRQQAEMTLTVSVANLKLTNSSSHAPQSQQDGAAHIQALVQGIHNLLHGYAPHTQAGQLLRQSMRRIKRDDGVQLYEINYSFAMHNI